MGWSIEGWEGVDSAIDGWEGIGTTFVVVEEFYRSIRDSSIGAFCDGNLRTCVTNLVTEISCESYEGLTPTKDGGTCLRRLSTFRKEVH